MWSGLQRLGLSRHGALQRLQTRCCRQRLSRHHVMWRRLLQRVSRRQGLTGLQLDLCRHVRRRGRLRGRRSCEQLRRGLLHGLNELHLLTRLNLQLDLRWRNTHLKARQYAGMSN